MPAFKARGHTAGGEAAAEDIELGEGEYALLQVEGRPVGGKDGEECPQVLQFCSLDML